MDGYLWWLENNLYRKLFLISSSSTVAIKHFPFLYYELLQNIQLFFWRIDEFSEDSTYVIKVNTKNRNGVFRWKVSPRSPRNSHLPHFNKLYTRHRFHWTITQCRNNVMFLDYRTYFSRVVIYVPSSGSLYIHTYIHIYVYIRERKTSLSIFQME